MGDRLHRGPPMDLRRDAGLDPSRDEDLYPTDVLGSGTFGGGCGLYLDRWIGPDVRVTLRVEGLGEVSNRVVRRH